MSTLLFGDASDARSVPQESGKRKATFHPPRRPEALEHWEVSRVSAVVALAPIVTIAVSWLVHLAAPGLIAPDPLDALSLVGALLVVAGSAACALASPGAPVQVDDISDNR